MLEQTLERSGYVVEMVKEGAAALVPGVADDAALVLLDVSLPDVSGVEVCRRLRARGATVPIIMVSARERELDRVVGLDAGADDYVSKPFSFAELEARIRAVLRRSRGELAPATGTDADGLVVDVSARRVAVDGRPVDLTVKEFDLLALLAAAPGHVVTREDLMDNVWDENWFGSTKTLDVTIARLRHKLRDVGATDRITTVRGVGYRLDQQVASEV